MKKEVVGSMSEWAGMLKDFFRQIEDGSKTQEQTQAFLERRNPFDEAKWLQEILSLERQYHLNFFGQEFDLVEFEETLKKYGQEKRREWQELGLEPHFLPDVAMNWNREFPGWKVKPGKWYYEQAEKSKILRDSINGKLVVDKTPYRLEGISVLIDRRLKPKHNDDKQMYQNDNLLGPVIEKLREEGKIEVYKCGPQSSRFGVSSKEWKEAIKQVLAEKLGFKVNQVRLERTIEANVISQLYPNMPRKEDGITNTWVWYEEYFERYDSRLDGGDSRYGGLAHVYCGFVGGHWGDRSLRSLAVL